MIAPRLAPVRPRILSAVCGEALPLDDEVRRLLNSGTRRMIVLTGGSGAGKTTALEHLAAVLSPASGVLLLDEPDLAAVAAAGATSRVIYAAAKVPSGGAPVTVLRLAPWGRDELIEYLLAAHKDRCASVMARLRPQDNALCEGLPDLWRAVLDRLAGDDTIPDAPTALRRHVAAFLVDTDLLQRTRSACLSAVVTPGGEGPGPLWQLVQHGFPEGLSRALRHRTVQMLLAADKVVGDLRSEGDCEPLSLRLPRPLVQAVGTAVAADRGCLERLRRRLAGPPWGHAMAASVLHAAGARWLPETRVLRGAYLSGVAWRCVSLAGANLAEADLTAADLRGADLRRAVAHKTALGRSRLAGALLGGIEAAEADFAGADLARVRAEHARFEAANLKGADLTDAVLRGASFFGANLTGAVLCGADLAGATLCDAGLEGADFSGADLEGAELSGLRLGDATWSGAAFGCARMVECDLEGLDLPGACFEHAQMEGALLTGCHLPGASFEHACLRGAGLGDVDWEGASLRGADLRGATFHMGSTRSGLVGSPIACEGSRTGFYTDDYEEQSYKAPEEIRKANLCHADLRGARLDGVDFYLVDLRGARYDREHEDHFRRCGAILQPRVNE
jgi:uncharacterized protein YjbI with pentapeptide repeats/energy-coupling factor transporter ATP-binding protein EcfA2